MDNDRVMGGLYWLNVRPPRGVAREARQPLCPGPPPSIPSPEDRMGYRTRTLAAAAGTLLVAACSEPNGPAPVTTGGIAVEASAVKFWEAGATAAWNELATALTDQTPIDQSRMYTYLSLAQFRAAE